MKLEIPKCPQCDGPATGTIETVSGIALFDEVDADGCCDYGGETKIDWDSQRTVEDNQGNATLICEHGHEWQSGIEDYDDRPAVEEARGK